MNPSINRVLFVDDDAAMRSANAQTLELAGFEPVLAASATEAMTELENGFDGVVVSDIRMPGMGGLQLFEAIRAIDPDLPVILITGHGDVDMAVSALKRGVYDFIPKPFPRDRLLASIARAVEKRSLVMENRRLRAMAAEVDDDLPLIGQTPQMRSLRRTLRQIAETEVDVLIEGETGSGKDVVANLIHRWSARAPKPFVALNCGALPETVIESELFGHEAGAFTGAQKRRVGRIEHSAGGTLFLDEIESMPPSLQVKLLRVLETRRIDPLGTNESRPVNIRVVAASKVDLGNPTERRDFREDLYYRLNVVTLRIPPLRERMDDVPLLFAHFLQSAARRFGRQTPALTKAVHDRLRAHRWPGNVRELAHFAERTVLGISDLESIPTGAGAPAIDSAAPLPDRVAAFEAEAIRQALREHDGDARATIEALGIPRKTFYDKLQRHGIARRDFGSVSDTD